MKDPLDLQTRRTLYHIITANPGIIEHDIVSQSGLKRSTVRYELDQLIHSELIIKSVEGKFVHYFQANALPKSHRLLLKILSRAVPRALALYILLNPGVGFGQLADQFDLARSTLSYHVGKLVSAGAVNMRPEGRNTYYTIADEEQLAAVLIAFEERFIPAMRDEWRLKWEALKVKRNNP